ncbi:hypothetical protein BH20GEM2_BH20GEM2_13920 [soil metagenome]
MKPFRLLLLAPLLGACFLIPTDPAQYGEVRVQVSDSTGAPIAGAGVEARAFLGRMGVGITDADGAVTLDFLPFGDYRINVFPPIGFTPEGRSEVTTVGAEPTLLRFVFTTAPTAPPDTVAVAGG